MAFVLVNTQLVGHETRVPFLEALYLQDGLDILAATVLVLLAALALDRLLARDEQRVVLEQVVELQRRFLADTSHELRNPLTSLAMDLSLLQREDVDEAVRREAAGAAHARALHMQRLVNDLLLLARGDSAEMLQLEVVELDDALAEVAAEAAARPGPAPVVLAETAQATVLADPARVRQIFLNLVENAQRYTTNSGSITLRLHTSGPWAVVTCTDTGSGIAPEHVPHVFERFYQVDPSRSGGGAGLGLAIVKHLVDAHGGRVDLVSAVGAGTAVSVWLPLAESDA
jgi:signal transduction histidine kinase